MLDRMRHRHTRRNGPHLTEQQALDELRNLVAQNLGIEPDRIRFGELGRLGKLGTEDPHWLIFYRGTWCELPWHFDGPTGVTRDLVRKWYGPPE